MAASNGSQNATGAAFLERFRVWATGTTTATTTATATASIIPSVAGLSIATLPGITTQTTTPGSTSPQVVSSPVVLAINSLPTAGDQPTASPYDTRVILQELDPSLSLSHRLRLLRELADAVRLHRFDDILLLWIAAEQLAEHASIPHEGRQVAYYFMAECIEGQYDRLGELERAHFYSFLRRTQPLEDFSLKLRILRKLTKEGRDISCFEKNILTLLLSWLGSITPADQTKRKSMQKDLTSLIMLMVGIIKFNFVLFEEEEVVNIITAVCGVCISASNYDDIYSCLAFMDVIVRYGFVPLPCLETFVQTLCRIVNIERFTQSSWHIMRNILRSHCAYNSVRILCETIEDPRHKESTGLLRGSVFFIGMASWGSQRISGLIYSAAAVLPALLTAVTFQLEVVDLEVILCVNRLTKKFGKDLTAVEWDLIIDMLVLLRHYLREKSTESNIVAIISNYDTVIHTIEDLYVANKYTGSNLRYFELLSLLREQIDESLTLLLLNYRADEMHPSSSGWIDDWDALMASFFEKERANVRLRVLTMLSASFLATRNLHGSLLVERVIIPYLVGVPTSDQSSHQPSLNVPTLTPLPSSRLQEESNNDIASLSMELVVQAVLCQSDSDTPAIDYLLQGLLGCVYGSSDSKSIAATMGLLRIFEASLYWKSSYRCLSLFNQLIKILGTFGIFTSTRVLIVHYLLRLRASQSGRVFIEDQSQNQNQNQPTSPRGPPVGISRSSSTHLLFQGPSPYIGIQPGAVNGDGLLPIPEYLTIILSLLKTMQPYDVMFPILHGLVIQLANKSLFTTSAAQIRDLVSVLCDGILNASLAERITAWPSSGPKKSSDVYGLAFQLLAVLVGYKRLFTKTQHDEIILCFEKGLAKWNNTAKTCIHALNICSLELPLSMQKLLPSILVKFSQIASNPTMSAHILEFLSALIHAPQLHINFVDADYKRIFGIALQHLTTRKDAVPQLAPLTTNKPGESSSRSSINQVAPPQASASASISPQQVTFMRDLAHRVLLVWFIGLRISERRKYVPFITKGLLGAYDGMRPSTALPVHESTELIIDMLARYAFAACQSKPTRSYAADRLMEGAITKMWVYGGCIMEVSSTKAGWSEVVLRRATGTTAWLCRLENRPIHSDGPDYISLPAMLMMHVNKEPTDDYLLVNADTFSSETVRSRSASISMQLDPVEEVDKRLVSQREELEPPIASPEPDGQVDENQHIRSRAKTFSGEALAKSRRPRRTSTPQMVDQHDLLKEEHLFDNTPTPGSILSEPVSLKEAQAKALVRSLPKDPYALPSFQFLQMMMYPGLTSVTPVPLKDGEATLRAIKNLDRIPAVDFHKIGVIYVGPSQSTEAAILSNSHGSPKYTQFLQQLGQLLQLKDCHNVYTGGLDTENNADGEYAYYWQDDITQIIFHVATLMPSGEWVMKKRHIGNDYVTIVYNDSGQDYRFGTVPSQFDFVNIIIQSLDEDTVQVSMLTKDDLPEFSPLVTSKVISAGCAATFVRQVALHANHMAILHSQTGYVSNNASRLQQIRRIGERFADYRQNEMSGERKNGELALHVLQEIADFTVYS